MYINGSSWQPLTPGQSAYGLASSLAASSASSGNVSALTDSLTNGGIGTQLSIVNEGIQVFDLVLNSLDDGVSSSTILLRDAA